jgi:capsule polysaccharide modification protein KpsS
MIEITPEKYNEHLMLKINNSVNEFKSAILKSMHLIAKNNLRYAKRLVIEPPKTGEFYPDRRSGYPDHQASAPMEAPANWYGELVKHIEAKVTSRSVEIGTTIEYGEYLERGTTKMAPRPYIIRTRDAMQQSNMNTLQMQIDKWCKE